MSRPKLHLLYARICARKSARKARKRVILLRPIPKGRVLFNWRIMRRGPPWIRLLRRMGALQHHP